MYVTMYVCMQEAAAPSVEAGPSNSQPQEPVAEKQHRPRESNKSHVKDMLGAMAALQQQDRYSKINLH